MNILITGGTGFIGQRFINRFSAYRHTVLSRDCDKAKQSNSSSSSSSSSSSNIDYIESLSALDNLDAFDAVINLAGEPIVDKRWSQKQKHIIRHSRWDITEQLVDLIANSKSPPSVFISGSAIGIYGNSYGQTMTEQSPSTCPDFSSELCQKWEAIAEQAQSSTRVVHLRTAVVLGSNQGALKKMLLPFKLGLGAKLGDGQQIMSWIHIDDAVEAIHTLLQNPSCKGPYNLSAPNPVSNHDFTQTLARTLHRKAFLAMPEKALRLAMGESAELLLNSQNVVPQRLIEAGFEFKYPTLEKALEDLLGK